MTVRPFEIHVPDSVLHDLRQRLANTRWPDPTPGAGWDYGADVEYVRSLCDYWRDGYDWRQHEARLNGYPQFLATVDGVDIHFIHVRGNGPSPMPLCLLHGWPGSILEFEQLIGPLSDPGAHGGDPADAFDVVVPALPGYGFSGKPQEPGWGPSRVAEAVNTLMTRELGYEGYALQGGDWGGIISARLAAAHPEHVIAAHLNFVIAGPPKDMSDADRETLDARNAFQAEETGYSNVQGTKPMSLAIAQADSPAGLAAWIVEKFRTWSDCGGDIEAAFDRDTLLTNIMFYWAPNSIASAARLYYEARRDPTAFRFEKPPTPVAVADFPGEPWRVPRHWVEPRLNIQRWTEMPRGGHFAALEAPDLLTGDIRESLRPYR